MPLQLTRGGSVPGLICTASVGEFVTMGLPSASITRPR